MPPPAASRSSSSSAPTPRRSRRRPRSSGITPADIVKRLVVKRHDGTFLFAEVPGDRQISWAKLRAVVGVNKLQLPEASVALEATGYERGTITPLGSTTAWPVFVDERIVGRRVSMGAGEHGLSVFVEADELVAGLDATVADISGLPSRRPRRRRRRRFMIACSGCAGMMHTSPSHASTSASPRIWQRAGLAHAAGSFAFAPVRAR